MGYSSWRTNSDGSIEPLRQNGIGEGEGQALHHARIRSQADAGVNNVEIMSVDTDQWVMAFFYYAMAQGEAGSTRIVVRGQKGVYRWQGGSCIDAPN